MDSLTHMILTQSTCGEACWEAREDLCRCSCGGRNHGILRNGGTRPSRTRKMGKFWYEIHSLTNYVAGKRECLALRQAAHDADKFTGLVYYDSTLGDSYHLMAISKSQRLWPEVYPEAQYIIWKRIPNSLTGVE